MMHMCTYSTEEGNQTIRAKLALSLHSIFRQGIGRHLPKPIFERSDSLESMRSEVPWECVAEMYIGGAPTEGRPQSDG